jgi:Zn-dependent M28 family amino/carboxypeptidase
MKKTVALLFSALAVSLIAQQNSDLEIINRIKREAFERSQVMDHLAFLTDRYGPRLAGSPEFNEAAEWAQKRLRSYGLANVHAESWGPFGRPWTMKHYSVEMVEPRYSHLNAMPLAWSDSVKPTTADVVLAPFTATTQNLKKTEEEFEKYKAQWRGKLRGKIVLYSKPVISHVGENALLRRYTDADLADLAKAPLPEKKPAFKGGDDVPEDPQEAREYNASLSAAQREALNDRRTDAAQKRLAFFREEGAVAMLVEDSRSHEAMVFAESSGSPKAKYPLSVPQFKVTEEHYNRLARLAEMKEPIKVRLDLDAVAGAQDQNTLNIIGELPGGGRKDEVVMIGAHFDSWHGGTGATDNAAGSAVMIEVMRILSVVKPKLDRTVRIALWGSEEQGLLGSKAYVKEHFGDPSKGLVTAQHAKLDVYFNLDNGSGKIRGVYLQGHDAARPILEQWMAPFKDMGVTTLSLRDTGGTDHLSFDAAGLPGFQFIQDPLDYGTVTHHSSMDTYDHLIPADVMQASAVIAAMVYDAANATAMFPRKPLPEKETATSSQQQ